MRKPSDGLFDCSAPGDLSLPLASIFLSYQAVAPDRDQSATKVLSNDGMKSQGLCIPSAGSRSNSPTQGNETQHIVALTLQGLLRINSPNSSSIRQAAFPDDRLYSSIQ